MKDRRDERFEYAIDLDGGDFGVWGLRTFWDRNTALSYAESLAHNNPEISVAVQVHALNPKKNVLKTR